MTPSSIPQRSVFLVSCIGIALAVLLHWSDAYAGIGGVGNAAVNKGQFTTHIRFSFSDDDQSQSLDGRLRSRLMTDYGFTDDFAFGVFFQQDNPGNDTQQWDATIAEARFELTESATSGFYSGLRLRYTLRDGDKKPDNAHVRLILGMPLGNWDLRINQIFAIETGPGRRGGLGTDSRLQATYQYVPDHRAGLESFSDFGYGSRWTTLDEQNHTLGPVFTGKLAEGVFYETGYAYGLSRAAADHTFKIFITRVF